MHLEYKPDWEKSQKRFTAWWQGEALDGPLLGVWAPRDKPLIGLPKPPPASSPEEQWLNADYRIAWTDWSCDNTYFAGDAFPMMDTNLGPGSLALHLGSPAECAYDTVWYHPAAGFEDITKAELPKFNPQEKYWKINVEIARKAMKHFAGKALVTFPDLIENIDILASLRGGMDLLTDLLDQPRHIHRLQKVIVDRYFDYYDAFEPIIRDDDGGTCFSAFQIWGQGRTAKVQCDFSAMIGVEMFQEFVAPYLVTQCRRLDHALYHLDGVDAEKHLNTLLQISEIHAIQWTPGAGKPHPGSPDWYGIYDRILRAGKGAEALAIPIESVQPLVEAVGPKGMMIFTGAKSQEQADALVKASKQWKKR